MTAVVRAYVALEIVVMLPALAELELILVEVRIVVALEIGGGNVSGYTMNINCSSSFNSRGSCSCRNNSSVSSLIYL